MFQLFLRPSAVKKNDRPALELTCRIQKSRQLEFSENPIKIRFELRKLVLTSSVPHLRNPRKGNLGPSSLFECTRLLGTNVDFSK